MPRILVDLTCETCGLQQIDVFIHSGDQPPCPTCQTPMVRLWAMVKSATVRPDEIPGGLDIYHGLCNEDGTPRRYYSWSAIDKEAARRGLVRWSKIHTEDKTKDARVRADWLQSSDAKRARAQREEARADQRRDRERRQAMAR